MSNIRKTLISNCEKKFLIKNLSEWTRLDGRAFNEFRNITIEFGKDWGCCFVSLGKTKVLAQVSCEIQQPKSSRPSEGILNINIELNTMASPNFDASRQSELGVQLNRLLEKCLKDSKAVDLESLCIKMNEKVWAIRVDVNVLNNEGNILDCSSIAALAALAHFRRPDVTCDGEEFVIHSYQQRDPIPTVIHHYPVCVTYSIFSGGDFILADPNLLEEGVADAFLTIGLNAYRELCGMHLGGKADLNPDVILATATKAASRAAIVCQLIKDAVAADHLKRQEKQVHSFAETINVEDAIEHLEDLNICWDQWTSSKKKKKQKKPRQTMENDETVEQMEVVTDEKVAEDNEETFKKEAAGKVESLGKDSAALVPKDIQSSAWSISDSESDSDGEVMVVEESTSKPAVETIEVADSDSEEEAVIVLNADSVTNKKKRRSKKR